MSDPVPYVPGYSFSQYQATNPDRPLPADKVDNELEMIEAASVAASQAIMNIRRSDGALQNAIVTKQSLASDVLIGMAPPTIWQTNTNYYANSSTVFSGSKFYIALVDHNSGLTFDPTKWSLLADLTGAPVTDSGVWFSAYDTPMTANYTIQPTDAGKMLVGNSATPITFTFSNAASLGVGLFMAKNAAAGALTIAAATGQSIEGVAAPAGISLAKGWMAIVWVAGSALRAVVIPDYGGRVQGPNTSVAGNFVAFGDTGGHSLVDSGFGPALIGAFTSLPEAIKTVDYAIVANDTGTAFIANKATAIAFTLPSVTTVTARVYYARNIGAGDLTMKGAGTDTIEGSNTFVMKQGASAFFFSNGTVWRAISFPRFATLAEAITGTATDIIMAPAAIPAILSSYVAKPSVRQTVMSGPANADGTPNFWPATSSNLTLTMQNISPTKPFAWTIAKGFGTTGPLDYAGLATGPLSVNGTASSTNYVLIDDTGTLIVSTLKTIYQFGGAISVTNGQHTYDIEASQMYVGNGTTSVAVNRHEIGEFVAGASTITSTTAYAYNGRYFSGRFAVTAGANISKAHNIGSPFLTTEYKGAVATNGVLHQFVMLYNGALIGGSLSNIDYKNIQLNTHSSVSLITAANTLTSAVEAVVYVQRSW